MWCSRDSFCQETEVFIPVTNSIMKRILYITAFVPSEFTAGEKNTKTMLNELGNSYAVDLVYFKYGQESDYIPDSKNVSVKAVLANSLLIKLVNILLFPFVYPLFSVRFNWVNLRRIQKLIDSNHYDAIVFNYSQTFLYAKFLKTSAPRLLYCHDVIAQRVERSSNAILQYLCRKSEHYCLKVKHSSVYSVSGKDCDLIKRFYGIHADVAYLYIDQKSKDAMPSDIHPDSYAIMGNWKRKDNVDGFLWLNHNVFPLIKTKITINVIGKFFPVDRITISNPLVHLNVCGFVDNPYPIIANSRALIAPVFTGAGVKVKVLEALACGTPVVGTDVAFEGIVKNDSMMLQFDDANQCAEMMYANIPLEARRQNKQSFISMYSQRSIPFYLQQIIGI